ncbi:unnamed protein product [Lymnaea stagnalis]|uniref:Uncharacterized protein n=1 Tax=Lymnaea stagnalis TaxID=6523 RepID=A0AAV2HCR8_LYMST
MASTKVTFVTGTAEVKRRDPYNQLPPHADQHLTTEPQKPLQVTYVDGKCTCCPYGYHIDLDFLNFCRDLESGSTLRNLKRIQRTKRKLRKSMELMLDEQQQIATDPNSAPPDIVHSTEAGRLMHMINYERSATHRILNQIDSSVTSTIANIDGVRGHRHMSSDSDEPPTPYSPSYGAPYPMDDGMATPLSASGRTDSLTSLSSVSTMSSETQLIHQAQLYHLSQQNSLHTKTTTKVIENPVIEMATAEMKQYTTTSSAQLADELPEDDTTEPDIRPQNVGPTNLKTLPSPMSSKAPPDSPTRETLALSAQRIRELEEQVKTIPILQVRISVLKEEKRLLNLQLKANKSNNKPLTSTVGVGDGRVDVMEKIDQTFHPVRQFELPKSFTPDPAPPQKSPVVKSPPATFPKPVRTFTVGVGDHSVIEPYNLQPDLPTGYTTQNNETHTEIHTTTIIERERLSKNMIQPPSLNLSFQNISSQNVVDRDFRQLASGQPDPHFTINQIQRSAPKALTRTIGIGDGNVHDGSGLHVHEKEFRTVIIGQNNAVAKRNVGIDCRVPTRDVGVSFMCDEEKPATRTIGVNVNYDTSGILTSLDFKGETELRMALRGVLQRNVRSVGTNCSFKTSSMDNSTLTDLYPGISVGCGDEDQRIDVEIRALSVKKSLGVTAKPETAVKWVSTEKDWVLDASTNTLTIDQYHKASMTDKEKQQFASTNTEPTVTRLAANQTDLNMFISMNALMNASSNTEKASTHSSSVATDIIPRSDAGVNTSEKVTELFAVQKEKPRTFSASVSTDVIARFDAGVNTTEKVAEIFHQSQTEKKTSTQLKSILKKPHQVERDVVDGGNNEEAYSFSEITEVITPYVIVSPAKKEEVVHRGATQAGTFLSQTESLKKSSVEEGANHFSSYELTRRSSAPITEKRQKEENTTQSELQSQNSAFNRISPTKSEDTFQETVTEHYLITKDGKRLISEEKTTTSSRGGSGTTTHYSSGGSLGNQFLQEDASKSTSSSSAGDLSYGGTHESFSSSKVIGSTRSEKSHSGAVTNPYKTVENLAEVSSLADADSFDGGFGNISKTSSEGNLYSEKRSTSRKETTKSTNTNYDMRRAGSVEDFMPDDIRKYMSIDPSTSKDSGFGEDLQNRFSGESSADSQLTGSSNGAVSRKSIKLSKTITTKSTIKSGDKVVIQETKTVEGPDGKVTTTVTETSDDGQVTVREIDGAVKNPHAELLADSALGQNVITSSFTENISSSQSKSEGFDSKSLSDLANQGSFSLGFSESSTASFGGDAGSNSDVGNYGSLDRQTGKLKSIMKHSKSEEERRDKKTGIRFAETVTGGTGSSSEDDDNSSDSDSTTSFDEGSYDSQQGQVVYRCKDDEAIAQGLPGAQMFDQNIREIYELTDELREACSVLATYLMDSTEVTTKQLNSSQNIIQHEWFQVSSLKLSGPHQVEDFLSSVNEISKHLLKYIVNMTDANGNTAIHYCISHCNFEIASLFLDSEVCDINKRNKAGYTPIMLAGLASVQNNDQLEVVRRIFAMGDINARATSTQQTALMLAASHGKTEMVRLLVQEGAEINLQDMDGSTALMCACEHGHLDIVNFLLSQPNIDATMVDNENYSALNIAMEADHKDIGVVLYKHLNFSKPSSPAHHKKRKSSSSPTPSMFTTR